MHNTSNIVFLITVPFYPFLHYLRNYYYCLKRFINTTLYMFYTLLTTTQYYVRRLTAPIRKHLNKISCLLTYYLVKSFDNITHNKLMYKPCTHLILHPITHPNYKFNLTLSPNDPNFMPNFRNSCHVFVLYPSDQSFFPWIT